MEIAKKVKYQKSEIMAAILSLLPINLNINKSPTYCKDSAYATGTSDGAV